MAQNTSTNPALLYENITQNPTVANPTTAYTVGASDNVVIAGANSIGITLAATSNSPVTVTCVDDIATTARSGVTIIANGMTYTLGTTGCTAYCIRRGAASANKWVVIGSQTAS